MLICMRGSLINETFEILPCREDFQSSDTLTRSVSEGECFADEI